MQFMLEKTGRSTVHEIDFWVGANKTMLIDENIIYVVAYGPQDVNQANAHIDAHKKFVGLAKGPVNYMIDLNNAGKSTAEARKVWKYLSEREDTYKVALVGNHPVARVLAHFVMVVVQKNNLRFFKTEEEAILWLKE
jgi:hypothetical protein